MDSLRMRRNRVLRAVNLANSVVMADNTSPCSSRNADSSSFLRRDQGMTSVLHLLALHEQQAAFEKQRNEKSR